MMPDAASQLEQMVETQLANRDIRDPRVLSVFRKVDRARFVPPDLRAFAYDDRPLPIGQDQTISQPYMVALMTQSLDLGRTHRVLEIGTGSGYQTAILAELAAEVYTIEIQEPLLARARGTLDSLGYTNIHYRAGNGRHGWPEAAPFDRILCAAAAEMPPAAWIDQLADPGLVLVPVGHYETGQVLVLIEKRGGRLLHHEFCPCRFVPLVHERPRPS